LNTTDEIKHVLDVSRFAVMATQQEGQPHASLMAFTPMNGIRDLIIATYRTTLKYSNLSKDGRVAVLINNYIATGPSKYRDLVITAHGIATEVTDDDRDRVKRVYLARHPDFNDFLASSDCALLRVVVSTYEVVGSTEDVQWYKVDDDAQQL
jgi:nitroimidazol reductase NimA-like FMN-containing flavoprotein (pyridoxamine 5'-phosphate oxidase superfamily)